MKMAWLGRYIILVTTICVVSGAACPETCSCVLAGKGQAVQCHHSFLASVMASLPHNTAELKLNDVISQKSLMPTDLAQAPSSILHLTITNSTLIQLKQSAFPAALSSLLELDLSANSIKSISAEAFIGLSNLRMLNLSRNRLYSVGMALTPLVSLQQLDLSQNYLRDLHTNALQAQTSLSYLCLDGNKFHHLSGAGFQALAFLTELRIRNCQIFEVSEDFYEAIPRVRFLDLGNNRLVTFPPSSVLGHLRQLKHLYFDGNECVQLPGNQFKGLNLITLSLARNRITAVPADAFSGLTVETLDLAENKLIELSPECMQGILPRLVNLNVAFNPIHNIHPELFRGFRLLQTLNISACSLANIPADMLRQLYNLQELDMSLNHLRNISAEVIQQLKRLDIVNLQGNAWHCSCGILPLRNWIKSGRAASKLFCHPDHLAKECADLKCSTPDNLMGMPLFNLSDSQVTACSLSVTEGGLAVSIQIGIAVGCLVFSVGMLLLTIYLWRRGRTRKGLKQYISRKRKKAGNHDEDEEDEEEEERIEPFVDCDNESLKQSHHSFVVRHYFDQMVTDPKLLEPVSPSQAHPEERPAVRFQKDSMYSSSPSMYEEGTTTSHKTASVVVMGIESAL